MRGEREEDRPENQTLSGFNPPSTQLFAIIIEPPTTGKHSSRSMFPAARAVEADSNVTSASSEPRGRTDGARLESIYNLLPELKEDKVRGLSIDG